MAALRYALYRVGFWVRETGQALDKLGSRLTGNYAYREDSKFVVNSPRIKQLVPAVDGLVVPLV